MIARTLSILLPLAHILIFTYAYPGLNKLTYAVLLTIAWSLLIGGLWLLWSILRRHHQRTLATIEAEERLVEIKHSPAACPPKTIDAQYTIE